MRMDSPFQKKNQHSSEKDLDVNKNISNKNKKGMLPCFTSPR